MYDKVVNSSNCRAKLHLYTGCGKGKTTAALGLAFRALGHGRRVFLIQFLKKGGYFGEIKAARRFDKFKILQTGRKGWVVRDKLSLKDKQLAQKGLRLAAQAIASKKYDLVILDELNLTLHFGLLAIQEVKEILKMRSAKVEVVITGREAHPEIMKMADLISEIKEVKHYYRKGTPARKGIEY